MQNNTSHQTHKVGFWTVLAIVMGAEIGSGVLTSPTNLAPFGLWGVAGWVLSGIGAIFLALVFANLTSMLPKTGGPHAYVEHSFGRDASFFTAWTYWVMSWVSSVVVITACIGYLSPLLGKLYGPYHLYLEIILLVAITLVNIKGVEVAGHVEFFLTNIKVVPLIIVPLGALFYFNFSNFAPSPTSSLGFGPVMAKVLTLTLWGFVGLEAATTPVSSIENPEKTIPRAVAVGTIAAALLYVFNSFSVMGALPHKMLVNSQAPYADATKVIFGSGFDVVVSVLSSILMVGTLNAWTLASGQIGLGAGQDKIFPNFFAAVNKRKAPFVTLLISCFCTIPFLIISANQSFVERINFIIDLSVTAVVFVYIACVAAYIKIIIKENLNKRKLCLAIPAALFCLSVLALVPSRDLLYSSFFIFSGLPVFLWMRFFKKGAFK